MMMSILSRSEKTSIVSSGGMLRYIPTLLIAVVLIGDLMASHAYSGEPPAGIAYSVHAVRIRDDIRLTGLLDDPRWDLAAPVRMGFEVTPGDNTPAPQESRVKVLYNDRYVYFGFSCADSLAGEIRAHVTDRDKCFNDDWVMVILDTYGDYQRSYEFVVNPYGVQGDLLRTNNGEDSDFDVVWESAGAVNDGGWTAVMAIPFKSLRFPSRPAQQWTVEFLRNYPRSSRVQISWVPVDRNNPCLMCQGGMLDGISDVEASAASVDILPYVLGRQSGELHDRSDPSSGFVDEKITGRAGGGVRYAPTPDLAVEAVVNPDFSQVESDAAQISINSNFALSYAEKRPFFLLGGDMFQTQTRVVYSRMINDPLWATRVIGKSGSVSFSWLSASDRNTPFIVPGEETSDYAGTDRSSLSNILRGRYDFGGESYLGALVTTRNTGSSAHNYVGGIDWNYKFLGNYYFSGELFLSGTKELNDTGLLNNRRELGSTGHTAAFDGEVYNGRSALAVVQKNARDYSFSLQYIDRSPTFEAQDGFVPSNNQRFGILQQQYSFYPNSAFVDQWQLFLNTGLHYNYDGVHKETWALPGVYVQLKGQTNINVTWFAVNDELYQGIRFDNINRAEVTLSSRPSSFLTLTADGSFGKFIKRTNGAAMGRGHTMSVTVQTRPTARLELDMTYDRARLSDAGTGRLFYDGYIARATGIYQFTNEVFLRVIGQYDEFSSVVDVYPLLSYKLNPYTIFYTGSTYSFTDFGPGFEKTSRQYFLKLQYLFRS